MSLCLPIEFYFLLLPISYLCESGFSTLLHVKMKARNRLNVEAEMRLALANAQPRILFYVLLLPHKSARVVDVCPSSTDSVNNNNDNRHFLLVWLRAVDGG